MADIVVARRPLSPLFGRLRGVEALGLPLASIEGKWAIPSYSERKPPQRRNEGLVLGFTGERGEGKSLKMTGKAWEALQSGRTNTVYADFGTKFAKPFTLEMLLRFPSWLRDCWICMDEIDRYMRAVRGNTLIAEAFDMFLRQIRKRKVWVCWASQFPGQLAGMLIDQTDLVYQCHSRDNGETVPAIMYDLHGRISGREGFKWPDPDHQGKKYWGLYDTQTMFDPLLRFSLDFRGIVDDITQARLEGGPEPTYEQMMAKEQAFGQKAKRKFEVPAPVQLDQMVLKLLEANGGRLKRAELLAASGIERGTPRDRYLFGAIMRLVDRKAITSHREGIRSVYTLTEGASEIGTAPRKTQEG